MFAKPLVAAVLCAAALSAGAAEALTIRVTVTNTATTGGLTLTPLYVAFHAGGFDAFDNGAVASPGIERLAEFGDPSVIQAERLAVQPDSVGGVILAPAGFPGAPVIEPGESASIRLNVEAGANDYLTFLSMVLPSNDTFIGNDDPLAYRIFSAGGAFLGDQTIEVTGASIWDAATEVNFPNNGPAFVPGQDIADGAVEGGVVTPGQSLLGFAGTVLPNGQTLDAAQINFLSDPGGFSVATIRIAAVPLPEALPLLAAALGGIGLMARRRRRAA